MSALARGLSGAGAPEASTTGVPVVALANALAAAGYVPQSELVPGWIDVDLSKVDVRPIVEDYEHLDEQWRSTIPGPDAHNRMRLLTDLSDGTGLQIAREMRRADSIDSVLLLDDALHVEPNWGWPLRILRTSGSLGSDVVDSLRQQSNGWLHDLVDFVEWDAGSSPRVVDFAFVADDSDLEAIAGMRGLEVRALVLGGSEPSHERWLRIRELASGLGTATILVPCIDDPAEQAGWFARVLEEVSHNVPLDVAAARVSDDGFVIAGDAASAPLENVRLRMRQSSLREATRQGFEADVAGGGGLSPLLGEAVDESMFLHETDGAHVLRHLRADNALGVDLLPDPAAPRVLQADVRRDGKEVREAFRAGAHHQVDIWIGPVTDGTLVARTPDGGVAEIDSEDLHEGADCEILVWDSGGELKSAAVRVGRSRTSDVATFDVTVPDGASDYALSIALILNGRVAQMGVLRGPVTETGAAARREGAHPLEFVVGPQLADLSALTPSADRDVLTMLELGPIVHALIPVSPPVNDTPFERPILNAELAGLGTHSQQSIALLAGAQSDSKKSTWLASRSGASLFAELARLGFPAFRSLVNDFANTDRPKLDAIIGASLVHLAVFNATESRLAVELLYDRMKPGADAEWCDGFDTALETGSCPVCPPWSPDVIPPPSVPVCPAGFWGVRKQIERIRYPDPTENSTAVLRSRFPTGDERIGGLGNVRIGISDRVDKSPIGGKKPTEVMLDTIASAGIAGVGLIRDWKTWLAEVASGHPQVLVLLTHSAQKSLELGTDDLVDSDQIVNPYVRAPWAQSPAGPIVMLLGCDTATTDELSSFVETFRVSGASVVVGTSGTTLGRFAAPIAGELVALLNDPDGPRTVGEALTIMRRRTMKKGWVTGLLMTSFTDSSYALER